MESKIMKKFLCVFIAIIVISNLLGILGVVSGQDLADASQEYIVENMKFWTGDSVAEDIKNADYVSVDITRRIQYEDDDTMIFTFYSDSGMLIGMYPSAVNTNFGVKTNIKVPINISENKILAEVKAFVWNDLNDIIPVSNSLSSKNDLDTRFEVVTSPDDEENTPEGDDVYEIPDFVEETIPIVPSDKSEVFPEISGSDDIITFLKNESVKKSL